MLASFHPSTTTADAASVRSLPDGAKVLRRTSVREPLHRLSLFRVLSAPSGRDLTDAASAVVVEGWKLASTGLARADGGEHVEGTRIAPEGNTVVRYLTPSRWAAAQSSPGRWPGSQLARLGDVAVPVDLVYTWVDGADPEWLARKDRALHGVGAGQLNETAVSDSRFASRDELRYSLRSVEMYASWVRNVYIVTDRQVPAWLDTSNPRVRVVDHREIFTDPTRLPVFNSHAIESQLHHIDGLSDRYLYMNDDIFFGRPTSPELFFEGDGLTRFFLSTAVLDLDPPGPRDLPVLSAAKQNRELVERTFGRTITQKFKHTPHPQSRAVLDEMEERFPEIFEAASASRFRHPEDHSIASALHHYYAYATARAVPGDVSYVYQDIARPEAVLTFNRLRRLRDVDVFCLNDTDGAVGSPKERSMVDLLDELFPLPSRFERTA
ncbi:stealth family protein [Oerskovia sp. Sa1BUA8]|uniref:Stealth family protein n=1 Tax=Oerskovia douganii TaxID=2762210 RepID=A0A9D5UAQ8_9CELL|nr:stealth family protein [Oerskovia douganii]